MMFRRLLAVPVAVLAGLCGALEFVEPASADAGSANVVVTVSAARTILDTSGWSSVDVVVRNDGPAAASGVSVSLTLPAGLRSTRIESTSDWNCDWDSPTIACTYLGDLAPGASERAITESADVDGAQPGTTLEVVAKATTSTPESSSADNTAAQPIRIVPTGVVQGHLFNDLNADGIRQANEPAPGVGVTVTSQDDEDSYGFANSFGTTYSETVPTKRFKVTTDLYRFNWRLTQPNVGSDDTDSDLQVVSDTQYDEIGASPVFSVTATTPTVVDVGVVAAFRPTKISPATAVQGSTAVVTLTGASFTSDLTVALTRAGSDPIPGTVTGVAADRSSMTVSFPLAQSAPGAWMLTLDRMYGPHAEVANGFTVTLPAVGVVVAPAISGTVAVGSTVRAVPGSWNPAATSYAYQWAANGAAVHGATGATLKIPASLVGKRISVKVTASRADYSPGSVSSAAVTVAKGKASTATKRPAITGTAKAGRTVHAAVGSWSAKPDSYRYEWLLNGKVIRGATHSSLKLTHAMRKKKITVVVIARKNGYADGTAKSAAVKVR
jgi:Domain of unknown function DUF11